MNALMIDQLLPIRTIHRGEDVDYFIETQSYPIHLELSLLGISRIQFPFSRALLIRTSPTSDCITLHILKDVDLYSSFTNFEIDLSTTAIHIKLHENVITLYLTRTKETT